MLGNTSFWLCRSAANGRSEHVYSPGTKLGQSLLIEPGSPWEKSYNESFNGKLRDELIDREIVYMLREARILIE